jgi:hypothetical protein
LPLLGGNPGYSIGPGARSRNTTCGRAASSCQSSTISPATFVVLQSERFNDQSVTRLEVGVEAAMRQISFIRSATLNPSSPTERNPRAPFAPII